MSATDRIFVTVVVTVTNSAYYSKQTIKVQEGAEVNTPNDGSTMTAASVTAAARHLASNIIEKAIYAHQAALAAQKANDASAQDEEAAQ